jgi:hypothetical protein
MLMMRERDLLERTHLQGREDARVVDQDVDAAEPPVDLRHHVVDRGRVGDVGMHGERLAADLGRDRPALVVVALGDHRDGARQRERLGEGAAQSLSGPGDDRDPAAQRRRDHVLQLDGSDTVHERLTRPAARLRAPRARPTVSTRA